MTTNNPFETLFELQRGYIKQSQQVFEQAFEQAVKARKDALEVVEESDLVESGIENLRSAQEQGSQLTENAAEAYFDGLEESVDRWKASIDQARSLVMEQLEQLDEIDVDQWKQTKDQIDATVDETVDAGDELTRLYIDLFNRSVDAVLEVEERVQENVSEAVETAQEKVASKQ